MKGRRGGVTPPLQRPGCLKEGLSVLMAESDQKRISFAETIYTSERSEIVPNMPIDVGSEL